MNSPVAVLLLLLLAVLASNSSTSGKSSISAKTDDKSTPASTAVWRAGDAAFGGFVEGKVTLDVIRAISTKKKKKKMNHFFPEHNKQQQNAKQ